MPRADPTFHSADVIRFWLRNLDSAEKIEVLLFFFFFVPAVIPIEIVTRIIETRLVPVLPLPFQRLIVGSLLGYIYRILAIRVEALTLIFTARTRQVLLDGIEDIRALIGELEEDK